MALQPMPPLLNTRIIPMKKSAYIIILSLITATHTHAQQLTMGHADATAAAKARTSAKIQLSPAETRFQASACNFTMEDATTLYDNPAFMQVCNLRADSTQKQLSAVGYIGMAGADTEGDFLPYEGNGSSDFRAGAYGEYATRNSGILAGHIQYARGKHRNIGWSAMRLPELYLPYISTDSCGGDFKFESYYAEGSYAFNLREWNLGVKASFYGEQAYRVTDPRALNNTTWLKFNAGVARHLGGHLLMLDAGYGRNKQHMQLRYWRPGQQDRFFVCYGFGLYDTRQSAVSFGKARMYYDDQFNMKLQYMSPEGKPLQLHASLGYVYDLMETEESDILVLYEAHTSTLTPLLRLTYTPNRKWDFSLIAKANLQSRKGYENIIEKYLANEDYNSYDYRIIDSQQNYTRDINTATVAAAATYHLPTLSLGLQCGLTSDQYKEKYSNGGYLMKVNATLPHFRFVLDWQGRRDAINAALTYTTRSVNSHTYDVTLFNTTIKHLDFQHAFALYAYRAAEYGTFTTELTWRHRIGKTWVGLSGNLSLTSGDRLDDAIYYGTVAFKSSAPMIQPNPDKHNERYGSLTAFVVF